jgi:hypothetical protein
MTDKFKNNRSCRHFANLILVIFNHFNHFKFDIFRYHEHEVEEDTPVCQEEQEEKCQQVTQARIYYYRSGISNCTIICHNTYTDGTY